MSRRQTLTRTLTLLLMTALVTGCWPGSGERDETLLRIARWQDQRLAPQDSLAALIDHTDAHVRLAAVRAAGLIGRPDVLPSLVDALADRSGTVARQAAFSLGLLGDERAVVPLGGATRAVDPGLRLAALRGLAHIPHDGQALLAMSASGQADEAATAWDGLRNVAAGVDSAALHAAILVGLDRPEADVQWRVLRCAEVAGSVDLVPELAPFASAPVVQVRVHALRALARIPGEESLSAVSEALLADPGFKGRDQRRADIAAARAFGGLVTRDLLEALDTARLDELVARLVTLAGSPDSHVAETALTAMGRLVADWELPPEAALQESLLPVWRIRLTRSARTHLDSEHLGVRRAAVATWADLRGAGCAVDLVKFMKSEQSAPVLAEALTVFGRVHPDPLLMLGQYAASDQPEFFGTTPRPVLVNPLVRASALRAMAHVAHARPEVFPEGLYTDFVLDRLTAAAADDNFIVAATAADLLGGFPTRLSLMALAELWDSAAGPDRIDLQRAVLAALSAMGPTIDTLHRPDQPVGTPDSLLEIMRLILAESFDSDNLHIRYEGRQAALDTGLLPEDLVPSEASLLATCPAVRRSGAQAPLSLAFKAPRVTATTDRGTFTLHLDTDLAPNTCAVFLDLIADGYFDDMIFHRVVPDFVAQGGDPSGTGWGGPGYSLRSEWSDTDYTRGRVGIATSGKDTGGSQWFITLSPQPHLNGRYTIFGEVTDGMDVVDRLEIGDGFKLSVGP